jgi:hypothetical protein
MNYQTFFFFFPSCSALLKPRALSMLGKHSVTEVHIQPHMDFKQHSRIVLKRH